MKRGRGHAGAGIHDPALASAFDPLRLVGDLLVNDARARRVGKLVEAAFQRFNRDELAPLHAQLVELGFTGHDAALIVGAALRMAVAGIETFDE